MNKQIVLKDSSRGVNEIWKELPTIKNNPIKMKEYQSGIFNSQKDVTNSRFIASEQHEFKKWGGTGNVGIIGYYAKYNPPPTFRGLRRMKRVLEFYYANLDKKFNSLWDLFDAKYSNFSKEASLYWFFSIDESAVDILFENPDTQKYDEDLPLYEIMQNWEALIDAYEGALFDKINNLCKKEVQNG